MSTILSEDIQDTEPVYIGEDATIQFDYYDGVGVNVTSSTFEFYAGIEEENTLITRKQTLGHITVTTPATGMGVKVTIPASVTALLAPNTYTGTLYEVIGASKNVVSRIRFLVMQPNKTT